MPHTQSRYQQDLGFTDGVFMIPPPNFIISADFVLTRNAAGDVSINLAASKGPDTLTAPILDGQMLRTGFGEDIQSQFGGSGIPGSAQPQFYRPDQAVLLQASGQQLVPRTVNKLKGIKLTGMRIVHQVTVADLTTLNVRVDQIVHSNNVANAITAILADGANGLSKVARANPYVTTINFAAAQQIYRVTDLAQMWIELTVTTPVNALFRLYGVEMLCEFNYN